MTRGIPAKNCRECQLTLTQETKSKSKSGLCKHCEAIYMRHRRATKPSVVQQELTHKKEKRDKERKLRNYKTLLEIEDAHKKTIEDEILKFPNILRDE